MKILINYADEKFLKQQKLNTKTAKKSGGFDKVIEFSPKDFDALFLENHGKFIEENKRGGGYWLWKPYIILKTLVEYSNEGDYIFYCDSGAFFIDSVDYLIEAMEASNQNIFLTEIPLLEYQWTKKECFQALDCLDEKYLYSNQVQGTYVLMKNTEQTKSFMKDYLNTCSKYDLLNDNYDKEINLEMIDHRHDQSILSLLSKKYKFEFFRDISQYGFRPNQYITPKRDFCIKNYKNSNYPQILVSYRKDNWLKVYLKELLKDKVGFRFRVV